MKAEHKRLSRAKKKQAQVPTVTVPMEVRKLKIAWNEWDVGEGAVVNGLEVTRIPLVRGDGVFAKNSFGKGDVIVRYEGETISKAEGKTRHLASETCKMPRLLHTAMCALSRQVSHVI